MCSKPLLTYSIETTILGATKKEKKNWLDTLPIELRVKIFQLVLNTGKFNEQTQAHVFEISERGEQRKANIDRRMNNFVVSNICHQHFALLKTCHAILGEILALVNLRTHFIFASPYALARYAMGPRVTLQRRVSDVNFEELGRNALDGRPNLAFGNLRVLGKAEMIEVNVDAVDQTRLTSVEKILGLALNSLKLARRSKPLVLKSASKRR
jgi:hypothetical protein